MKIQEIFEIKEVHQTGYTPGVVVVLDTLLTADASRLVGRTATIHAPSGEVVQLAIDEAKEHGPVNSLFFRNLTRTDIPAGSDITICLEIPTPSSIAS